MKQKLVVLTGAGISAESGFSTFRDSDGLWERYPVEAVATPEGWQADPNLVTDFYNSLRRQLLTAQPNAAHLALAQLEHIPQAGEAFEFENLYVTVGQVKDKRILTLMVRVTPDPKHPAKPLKQEGTAEKKAE